MNEYEEAAQVAWLKFQRLHNAPDDMRVLYITAFSDGAIYASTLLRKLAIELIEKERQ